MLLCYSSKEGLGLGLFVTSCIFITECFPFFTLFCPKLHMHCLHCFHAGKMEDDWLKANWSGGVSLYLRKEMARGRVLVFTWHWCMFSVCVCPIVGNVPVSPPLLLPVEMYGGWMCFGLILWQYRYIILRIVQWFYRKRDIHVSLQYCPVYVASKLHTHTHTHSQGYN